MSVLLTRRSALVFILSIGLTLGPWAMSNLSITDGWAAVFTPFNCFSLVSIVCGVGLAWINESPLKWK